MFGRWKMLSMLYYYLYGVRVVGVAGVAKLLLMWLRIAVVPKPHSQP